MASDRSPAARPNAPAPRRSRVPSKRPVSGAVWFLLGLALLSGVSALCFAFRAWQWGLGTWAIAAPAILGGLLRVRGVQLVGAGLLQLVGFCLFAIGAFWFLKDTGNSLMFSGLGRTLGGLAMGMGLCLGLGGFLLSFPLKTS